MTLQDKLQLLADAGSVSFHRFDDGRWWVSFKPDADTACWTYKVTTEFEEAIDELLKDKLVLLYVAIPMEPKPLLMEDGSLHQFTIKGFRCSCGGNVFHKPDDCRLDVYRCNSCDRDYEAY